jgi:peptidoglycan hydrolase FlgJ
MTVTIPSDIVLDVMRGASARDVRISSAKLNGHGPVEADAGLEFSELMDGAAAEAPDNPSNNSTSGSVDQSQIVYSGAPQSLSQGAATSASSSKGSTSVYKSFERMFLGNVFELMLPSSSSGVFGDEPAGGIWRSMAADQLAGVYAESGGIGLTAAIHGPKPEEALKRRSEWPYFEATSISGFSG